MRRLLAVACLIALTVAMAPASAEPGAVVVTINSDGFHPGAREHPVDTLQVQRGFELYYLNLDPLPAGSHTVTSDAKRPGSLTTPLFDTGTVEFGEYVSVPSIPTLAAGTYLFHCAAHPGMRGKLVITP